MSDIFKVIIFCDTCEYFSDPNLEKEKWKKVKAILNNTLNGKLLITQPLKDEVEKKITDLYNHELESFTKTNNRTKIINLNETINNAFEQQKSNYLENYFKSHIPKKLFSKCVFTQTYPSISNEDIFKIALANKKPFRYDNSSLLTKATNGFRDLIIWLSLEEYIVGQEETKVLFLTTNTKDFCDDRNKLHKDFVRRLEDIAFPIENFSVITDHEQLNSYLTEYSNKVDVITDIKYEIKSLSREIDPDFLVDEIIELDNIHQKLGLSEESIKNIFLNFFKITDVEIDDIYEEDSDMDLYLVEGRFTIEYDFDFLLDKRSPDLYADPENKSPKPFLNWSTTDENYNKSYMQCRTLETTTSEFHFMSTIKIESGTLSINDLTINGVDIIKYPPSRRLEFKWIQARLYWIRSSYCFFWDYILFSEIS